MLGGEYFVVCIMLNILSLLGKGMFGMYVDDMVFELDR